MCTLKSCAIILQTKACNTIFYVGYVAEELSVCPSTFFPCVAANLTTKVRIDMGLEQN